MEKDPIVAPPFQYTLMSQRSYVMSCGNHHIMSCGSGVAGSKTIYIKLKYDDYEVIIISCLAV
ncbi:MAG: hypothetical protein FWH33_07990, partial [Oscillospiraceae bacterium]|nr:hypothetical protein [Oscillospiraceae bacterium]